MKCKIIYQPKGPAGEYAKWAVNLHNGCTHGCTYCYNRRGVLSHAFGEEPKLAKPILKEALKLSHKPKPIDGALPYPQFCNALDICNATRKIISHDLDLLGEELRNDGGLFFSFKCDPMTDRTAWVTLTAVRECMHRNIPVIILTKSTRWIGRYGISDLNKDLLTIGFTLTGMDEMEVNAPSTKERIEALHKVHEMGIKTFVSLEPVIDIKKAIDVLHDCLPYSDEIRIGLQSPYKKDRYTRSDIIRLLSVVQPMPEFCPKVNIVLKDSVYRQCEVFGLKVDKE